MKQKPQQQRQNGEIFNRPFYDNDFRFEKFNDFFHTIIIDNSRDLSIVYIGLIMMMFLLKKSFFLMGSVV